MSRRIFRFCLVLAAVYFFMVVPQAQGQRIWGISVIVGYTDTQEVEGYSSTWLDYNAAMYYDPAVLGELYDDTGIASELPYDSGYDEGVAVYPAQVFTRTTQYRPNNRYHVYSTHFIRAYFFYDSCSGFFSGCSFDPFGFSYLFTGAAGGGRNWFGSAFQYLYVQTRRYTLGTTHVSIVTSSNPPPTPNPTPTPDPTPCSTAPGANSPCPPQVAVSFDVTPRGLLPVGVPGPATAHRATVTVSTNPAQPGRAVSLELVRVENSGGHMDAHHVGTRPLGRLRRTQGTLDNNGRFQTTYEANHIGQTVSIRMTYNNASTQSINVGIGEPDLERLYDGTNFFIIGTSDSHPNNHYGTATANLNLHRVADDYKQEYYGAGLIPDDAKLRYNDQSL